MSTLQELQPYVKRRITEDGVTHCELSEELKAVYPNAKGMSERNIRRFCEKNQIHRTSRLSDTAVQQAVVAAISMVKNCCRICGVL